METPSRPAASPDADRLVGVGPFLLLAGLGAAATLLAARAVALAFVTDDAFIAFRYARNLAEGHGLVWNPGGDAVEGYTSLLWVLLLAGAHALGTSIELAAPIFSGIATAGLVLALVLFLRGSLGPVRGLAAGALATLLLAVTRSFATWTTGGLETRLFEALVVAGVLRLLAERRRWRRGASARPWAGLLLGLAALTRPEGLLLGSAALAGALPRSPAPGERRAWLRAAAVFAGLALAHAAFRWLYHGDLVPNTWYAKVGGHRAFGPGARYLGAFLLEHAAWSWVPLLVLGALAFRRREEGRVPLLVALVLLPYLLFVVAIGGDHFEYRPLDLVLPFAFLLVAAGAVELAAGAHGAAGRVLFAPLVALVVLGLIELPARAAATFPAVYRPGFPGLAPAAEACAFLDPAGNRLHALPGLAALARLHRAWVVELSSRFVGLRREEHVLFQRVVEAEAARLRRLIDGGFLPADLHVAVDCVGTIGYRTDLQVYDRLGLVERAVARSPDVRPDLLAHRKYASPEQARAAGVELWAVEGLQLAFEEADPRLATLLTELADEPVDFAHAPATARGAGLFVVAWPPNGRLSPARTPHLVWHGTGDAAAVAEALAVHREALARAAAARGSGG